MADTEFEILAAAGAATAYEASPGKLAMDGGIHALQSGRTLVGRALTVSCEAGDNLPIHRALEAAAEGDVLVVSARLAAFGYWGEVTTVAAMARGLSGLVIDGGVRDVAAIRHLGFPVWSRVVAIHGTVKANAGSIRQPVTCGGVMVHDRDVVVADDDGVSIIAAADVEATAMASRQRMTNERAYLDRLRNGELTVDVLQLRRLLARGRQ